MSRPIASTVEIARPPDVVFAYAVDPSRFGEWQRGVVEGHLEGPAPPTVGTICKMTRRQGAMKQTSTSRVIEIDPPRTWAIHGIDGPIRADVRVVVEPLDTATRSKITIQLEFSGSGFGRLILPLVQRQAEREVPQSCRKLKERLEAGDVS
ncbi:MAG: SRPBCC family protein [Acidimicrobiales bacterium]